MAKKKRGGSIFFLIAFTGLAAVGYGAGPGGWFAKDKVEAIAGAPVQRGPLRISEVVRGNLEAKNSISLKCEIDRDAVIIYLAEQGPIEVGALVAEIDVSELDERRVTQEIDVKKAEADFVKAKEQYEIQVIQNQTDIAEAELALEFAILDLDKYRAEEGEKTHELEAAREKIALSEEELARATEEHKWTEELAKKGFAQDNEVKQDKLTMRRREIELRQAERELALLETFSFKRRESELQADVETKRRDVQKVEKQAIARLADFESEREAAKYQLSREQEQLDKYREQISKAKIYAPESGILVHGRERSRWGNGDPIKEGTEVRRNQEIATIPRAGGMVAEASLHETKLKKVGAGQRCLVQIDALPGQTFEARVDYVAMLPETGGWMTDPNQRLYPAEIVITEGTPEMRPGMSCNIEILIDDLEDVIYVPRQCVFLDGNDAVCFVRGEDEVEVRVVEPGLDNNKWVAIDSGLEEGEVVLLAPPASFEPREASSEDQGGDGLPGWQPDADTIVPPTPGGRGAPGRGQAGGPAANRMNAAGDAEKGKGQAAMRERLKNMSQEERDALMQKYREGGGQTGRPKGGERPGGNKQQRPGGGDRGQRGGNRDSE
ncbi:MAG: HlyD family efflux transporter periplasmic adaptor subunit [bacterium]|nr:HlyD family efflux transporter periplasmic adaptor subunit [bacterium]